MSIHKPAILLLLVAVRAAAQGDYSGPSILSRGGGGGGGGGKAPLSFRPYALFNSSLVFGTQLPQLQGPTNQDSIEPSTGALATGALATEELSYGVYGGHAWRKTYLSANYSGTVRRSGLQSGNTSNQFLQLSVNRQLKKRLSLGFAEGFSSFNNNQFAGATAGPNLGVAQRAFGGVNPLEEFTNGRVTSSTSSVNLTYTKNARLSFNGGVVQFSTRRTGALVNVNGTSLRGDIAYRISTRSTLGIDYSLAHYDYKGILGRSDIQTIRLSYATRFWRRWEFSSQFGGSRIYTLGLTRVIISPEVAAIIGQTVGVEITQTTRQVPDMTFRLSRSFRRSSLSVNYSRGTTPGNGTLLTSQHEGTNYSYSYTGVRKLNLGFNGGTFSTGSVGRANGGGANKGYSVGAGLNYQLKRYLSVNLRCDRRQISGTGVPEAYQKGQLYVATGISFSPGEQPLALW